MKIHDTTPLTAQEAKKETEAPPAVTSGGDMMQAEQRAVHQVLGLDDGGDQTKFKHEVDLLLKWAKENAKGTDPEDLKWAIRQLEIRVGTPPISENRVRYLARYAYLLGEHKKIEKQIKSFTTYGT